MTTATSPVVQHVYGVGTICKAFGAASPDLACSVALRMDHGTQHLSDHVPNQIRFWGLAASIAFVEKLRTAGVAERFNRAHKGQATHGHLLTNIEDVPPGRARHRGGPQRALTYRETRLQEPCPAAAGVVPGCRMNMGGEAATPPLTVRRRQVQTRPREPRAVHFDNRVGFPQRIVSRSFRPTPVF